MTGYRCPSHTPAALDGRPEVTPDPELTLDGLRIRNARIHAGAVAMVLAVIPGTTIVEREAPAAMGRCEYCGGSCTVHHVFPVAWSSDPGRVYGQPPAQTSRLGLPAGTCDVCGEPRDGLGLTEKCKDKHTWCRGCSVSFSQPGGLLLLNPQRRCRRAHHKREEAA